VWLIFLRFYCIILTRVVVILVVGKLLKFRDVATRDRIKKIIVAIHFFNLGGVPPLIGFAVKLMVLKSLVRVRIVLVLILVFMSAIVLFIYTSIIYQAFTIAPNPNYLYGGSNSRNNLIIRIPILFGLTVVT